MTEEESTGVQIKSNVLTRLWIADRRQNGKTVNLTEVKTERFEVVSDEELTKYIKFVDCFRQQKFEEKSGVLEKLSPYHFLQTFQGMCRRN
jgi:hypothetical protein